MDFVINFPISQRNNVIIKKINVEKPCTYVRLYVIINTMFLLLTLLRSTLTYMYVVYPSRILFMTAISKSHICKIRFTFFEIQCIRRWSIINNVLCKKLHTTYTLHRKLLSPKPFSLFY